jgi:hypothetical protein
MMLAGYPRERLMPTKGYHFPVGCARLCVDTQLSTSLERETALKNIQTAAAVREVRRRGFREVQDAPYVEYKGKVEKEEIDALVKELNGAAATFIARGSTVGHTQHRRLAHCHTVCMGPHRVS